MIDPARKVLALEEGPDGHMVGRDPRSLVASELEAIGHRPMSAQEAIRLRCIDCCGGVFSEVRKCTAIACPAWPFRMGKSPWKAKRTVPPERIEAMQKARMEKLGRSE